MRWLMELIDFPVEGSAGIFVGVVRGLSMPGSGSPLGSKNRWLECAHGTLQGDHPPLVLYISEEGHSCLRKSSHLLGLGEPRLIPVDAGTR